VPAKEKAVAHASGLIEAMMRLPPEMKLRRNFIIGIL